MCFVDFFLNQLDILKSFTGDATGFSSSVSMGSVASPPIITSAVILYSTTTPNLLCQRKGLKFRSTICDTRNARLPLK